MNEDRIKAFTDEVGAMKLAGAKTDREKWMYLLGSLLLVAGVALVVVGGIRASGTTNAADQWAAIASGSLIGLALILVGVALFVRYSIGRLLRFWLVRLLHEHRSETDRLIEAMKREQR